MGGDSYQKVEGQEGGGGGGGGGGGQARGMVRGRTFFVILHESLKVQK